MTNTKTNTKTKIINAAIRLFSQRSYESISMRNIADEVHISGPALYNHFENKQTLYIAAISESFKDKAELLLQAMTGQAKPIKRLEHYVKQLSVILLDDPEFRLLMQREMLEGDEDRLRYMAQEIFGPSFQRLLDILIELKPDCDAHGLAIMIIGMIQKPLEFNPLYRFFPGSQQQHCNPTYITRQVMAILSVYFGENA